ncbi:dsDNA-specific endonuclease/ATPase MutS2 [Clostridium saccharoperbutylacetonicum]|uniref:MutS2 protein MutS n=1 Tax=Clostridium saccharoperbutylacetonicum N1-4(HMT) TaxID=931276 RepID=M1MXY7_9CLOT|nr:MutS2 protein MutS [Clostridium saccharoperbutylacetonicum]AGF59396.1 MutS2 protein MutS [Clostridium saccharoperbutylacetonicum N1-4(HMT)]NRT59813.1 dsDNA-specific endonuclease/ATPase MutS2 [Clostridium saccharoperbutylacetonicum]NSB23125.1 dsDNA-specific endonuclease/ATPase MutS2 [Clostridium saccharoperbutylacetonicum]NSB42496.1 dsDNA-specific endonuclease/ATPase MutS2 [Clostridium saccharoperbutylacetonicum]
MNNKTLEKLHFDKLKEIVKAYCISSLGKELIDKLTPSTDLKQVNRRLEETSEGRRLLDASYHIPLEGVANINPLLDKIDKGAVLEPTELLVIGDFLRGSRKIKSFIKNKEGYAKTLAAYGESITELEFIEEEINKSINGSRVDAGASKELKKIRNHIDICEGKIKEKLNKFIKNPSNKEFIQEYFISQRNGRFTVPIKAGYKNIVQGTIVEASAKGNTVFVEPYAIEKYSSELNILKAEESIEEYKILATITDMIYGNIRELKINIEVISEFDMIMAKAKYSREIGGIKPKLNEIGYINIKDGVYPLINNPVPLNFKIGDEYRSLIITGPNAGGKTVVLKTIGLLILAVQSGLHIRCNVESEISIFKKILIDIGDEQSLENALSTFSSHVKNLSEILRESNKSTLLLLDEIGSGTEPNEGAALAIAILEEFYQMGCITIASTHYGEIKNFSQKHPHFQNAAMEFKLDTLEPLYKLHIGQSGDSNALYIARKMGISEKIIEKTKGYIENKNYNYDTLNESKVNKTKKEINTDSFYQYERGDKIRLLDKNLIGIVYEEMDKDNNLIVMIDKNKEFIKVNYKRIKLEMKAEELYPEGYDLNQLFVEYRERKLEHDINRGSKKVIKRLLKEGRKIKN